MVRVRCESRKFTIIRTLALNGPTLLKHGWIGWDVLSLHRPAVQIENTN